jgi:hypothetical protein
MVQVNQNARFNTEDIPPPVATVEQGRRGFVRRCDMPLCSYPEHFELDVQRVFFR